MNESLISFTLFGQKIDILENMVKQWDLINSDDGIVLTLFNYKLTEYPHEIFNVILKGVDYSNIPASINPIDNNTQIIILRKHF